MLWHNIPSAMRGRRAWVCADDDKNPINARTGAAASANEPTTWSTFEEATATAISNGWEIGYVLSNDDPFGIIDLDDKPEKPAPEAMKKVHADIIAGADTYIERSQSGYGYHVIVMGKPQRTIKTKHIEVYGQRQFLICTGDVVKDLPLADGRKLLDQIHKYFGNMNTYVDPQGNIPDYDDENHEEDDDVLIERAMNMENGEKFASLWEGDISLYDDDHSAADSALLNLLCFLTPHNAQVRRLFRKSKLYRPDQANRANDKYLNYSIIKWRTENPPLDLSQYSLDIAEGYGRSVGAMAVRDLDEAIPVPKAPSIPPALKGGKALKLPSAPIPKVAQLMPNAPLEFAPGIIGEVARFVHSSSYMPIREGSLIAALGYLCGLIGRAYHVNGLGLNQYFVLIADTGVGKEGGKRGISFIHDRLITKVPMADPHLGSSDFSAGVSMVKELGENPCMLGVAGEIGMMLRTLLDPKAPSHLKDLKRALTDAWSASGPSGRLNARKYSDRTKNIEDVRRPCLSLLGESVPSHFYGSLTVEAANDGFIPRWIIAEYKGDRPNANRNANVVPNDGLVDRLSDLYVVAKGVQDSGQMVEIQMTPEAQNALWGFEDSITERMRSYPAEHPVKGILNRTNEKALKIAGLLAATQNPHVPVIDLSMAQWAMKFITESDSHMVGRFEEGSIGDGEEVFDALLRDCIRKYQSMNRAQRQAAKCPKCLLDSPVLPRSYLNDALKRKTQIANHPAGVNRAIDICINEALATGLLVKLPPAEKVKLKLRGGEAYLLGDGW